MRRSRSSRTARARSRRSWCTGEMRKSGQNGNRTTAHRAHLGVQGAPSVWHGLRHCWLFRGTGAELAQLQCPRPRVPAASHLRPAHHSHPGSMLTPTPVRSTHHRIVRPMAAPTGCLRSHPRCRTGPPLAVRLDLPQSILCQDRLIRLRILVENGLECSPCSVGLPSIVEDDGVLVERF